MPPTHTPEHPWPSGFHPDRSSWRGPRAVLDALWRAESPLEEIEALAAGENPRNREMVLTLLLSYPRPKHADLGHKYGISRARVGQLVNRFAEQTADWRIRLPWCEHALGALHARGGVFPSSGPHPPFGDGAAPLAAAFELGFLSAPVEWDEDLQAWVTAAGRENVAEYASLLPPRMRRIGRQRRNWGAFELSLLPDFPSVPLPQRIRLALPDDVSRWRVTSGLAVLPKIGTPLLNRIRKALAAVGSIGLRDLCDGIGWTRSPVPTADQLRDILTHSSSPFRLGDGDIVSSEKPLDESAVLTRAENRALGILRDGGGIVDRELYMHRMTAADIGAPLASAVLRSPFIVRHRRGVYGIRGQEPSSDQIDIAAGGPEARFQASIADFERRPDSAVLSYRLAIACVSHGQLPLPSGLALPTGSWPAYFPDDTYGNLRVRDGTIRGLRPWMRRNGIAAGADLVVEVDIDARVMHVLLT